MRPAFLFASASPLLLLLFLLSALVAQGSWFETCRRIATARITFYSDGQTSVPIISDQLANILTSSCGPCFSLVVTTLDVFFILLDFTRTDSAHQRLPHFVGLLDSITLPMTFDDIHKVIIFAAEL